MANRMIHTPSYLATARAEEYWTTEIATVTDGWYDVVGGSNGTMNKAFDSQSGWTVGFRFKYGVASGATDVVEFIDGTTSHLTLRFVGTSGTFLLNRGSTLIATGTTVLAANAEYYIEFRCVIADSPNGVGILNIDGVADAGINSTALDTRNAGNASANQIGFTVSSAGNWAIKDIYINDNSGGVDDTFWGPVTVATLTATGAGASAQWDPLSSTNASNVDEAEMDGDTTYNSTSTNNETDSFVASNTGYSAGTVKGVEWAAEMRRTDSSATARVARVFRIGGTDYVGADTALQTTYRVLTELTRVSPATAAAWTVSELDGIEIGYKRTAA